MLDLLERKLAARSRGLALQRQIAQIEKEAAAIDARLKVAEDELLRSEIRAPASGRLLSVAVNGNALKLMSSDEVVPENVAKPGATVSFDIAAIKPSTGYVAGNYQGLVNMMFEAGTP